MRPYCTKQQLLSLYKATVWPALEQGCVCYAHATNTWLQKIEAFQQSTIRMLGLQAEPLPSMTTRRNTSHAAMVYKQSILGQGPSVVQELFRPAPPDPRSHLRRSSTEQHPHQLHVPRNTRDLKIYEQFCIPFRTYNSLPNTVFPQPPSLPVFKRLLQTISFTVQ